MLSRHHLLALITSQKQLADTVSSSTYDQPPALSAGLIHGELREFDMDPKTAKTAGQYPVMNADRFDHK